MTALRPDPALSAFGLDAAARGFAASLLDRRRATASAVLDAPPAMATLAREAWDSEVLGLECGRLESWADLGTDREAASAVVDWADERLRSSEIDYVVGRFPTGESALARALGRAGWVEVDLLETFACVPGGDPVPGVSPALAVHEAEVVAIGETAFPESRFAKDPALGPGVSARVHREWTLNSLRRVAAEEVLVTGGDRVEGFVTCLVKELPRGRGGARVGSIGLIATASHARGRGVGRRLVAGALAWFSDRGCDLATVGTQASNAAATRLYRGAGFRVVSTSVTLRWARREVAG